MNAFSLQLDNANDKRCWTFVKTKQEGIIRYMTIDSSNEVMYLRSFCKAEENSTFTDILGDEDEDSFILTEDS